MVSGDPNLSLHPYLGGQDSPANLCPHKLSPNAPSGLIQGRSLHARLPSRCHLGLCPDEGPLSSPRMSPSAGPSRAMQGAVTRLALGSSAECLGPCEVGHPHPHTAIRERSKAGDDTARKRCRGRWETRQMQTRVRARLTNASSSPLEKA